MGALCRARMGRQIVPAPWDCKAPEKGWTETGGKKTILSCVTFEPVAQILSCPSAELHHCPEENLTK